MVYRSESGNRYVFCTVFASTERFRNGGEWSFCARISFHSSQKENHSMHYLEALGDRRCLVAAAISPQANIMAVLESNGTISLFGIQAHREGGLCIADEPIVFASVLNPQRAQCSISPSSIGFDDSGMMLMAVGPDGVGISLDLADRSSSSSTMQSSDGSSKSRWWLMRKRK